MPYRPTASERKSSNYKRRNSDRPHGGVHPSTQIQVKADADTEWADQYVGLIWFDIEQVAEKRPDTLSRKFCVRTAIYIPPKKLKKMLTEAMPECSVYPLWGYRLHHNFDVKLHKPVRLDTFIWRCIMALAG